MREVNLRSQDSLVSSRPGLGITAHLQFYKRPISANMITISNTNPNPPLG
jgi:hypothetical protein